MSVHDQNLLHALHALLLIKVDLASSPQFDNHYGTIP